jgi:glc operon protein GlcG
MKYTQKLIRQASVAAVLLTTMIGSAEAQLVDKPSLSLEGAKIVAAAAAAEAKRVQAGGAIAVVDDGGNLLYLERLDNTFAAAANISIAKARSAANFRRDTRVFEDAIKNGRVSLVANPELLPLQGGVPVTVDGRVVGAIGVAGANSAQQDEDIAKVAAQALSKPSTPAAVGTAGTTSATTYLSSARVAAAFKAGMPLVETAGYKVHASRREAPGMAEVHVRDTDIIYVLEGTATVVTGGEVVEGTTTAPDEIRGASIRGGQAQRLEHGDVFIVPQGVPHWFKDVQGPFLYYVVKATGQAGGTLP